MTSAHPQPLSHLTAVDPHPRPLSHLTAVDPHPRPLSHLTAGEGSIDASPVFSPRPARRGEGPGVRGAAT